MKATTAMLFIVIIDAVMLLVAGTGTFSIPQYNKNNSVILNPVYFGGDTGNYTKRINVTASFFQENTTWEINLTELGVTFRNPEEIKVKRYDNVTVPYQTYIRGIWNLTGRNVSEPWQKDNFTVIRVVNGMTASNCCYVLFGNTSNITFESTDIIIRTDTFESYTAGVTSLAVPFSGNNVATVVRTTNGQKGLSNIVDANPIWYTNVNVTNNVTVFIEYNSTDWTAGANDYILTILQSEGLSGGYRAPQETADNVYSLLTGSGGSAGANATIASALTRVGMNITFWRAGNKTNLIMSSVGAIQGHISGDDTSTLAGSKTEHQFGGGQGQVSLQRYIIYNNTVLEYLGHPILTASAVQTGPTFG